MVKKSPYFPAVAWGLSVLGKLTGLPTATGVPCFLVMGSPFGMSIIRRSPVSRRAVYRGWRDTSYPGPGCLPPLAFCNPLAFRGPTVWSWLPVGGMGLLGGHHLHQPVLRWDN